MFNGSFQTLPLEVQDLNGKSDNKSRSYWKLHFVNMSFGVTRDETDHTEPISWSRWYRMTTFLYQMSALTQVTLVPKINTSLCFDWLSKLLTSVVVIADDGQTQAVLMVKMHDQWILWWLHFSSFNENVHTFHFFPTA